MVALDGGWQDLFEEGDREFGQGQVEVFFGGGFEDLAAAGGDFRDGRRCKRGWRFRIGFWCEEDDVQFGFERD